MGAEHGLGICSSCIAREGLSAYASDDSDCSWCLGWPGCPRCQPLHGPEAASEPQAVVHTQSADHMRMATRVQSAWRRHRAEHALAVWLNDHYEEFDLPRLAALEQAIPRVFHIIYDILWNYFVVDEVIDVPPSPPDSSPPNTPITRAATRIQCHARGFLSRNTQRGPCQACGDYTVRRCSVNADEWYCCMAHELYDRHAHYHRTNGRCGTCTCAMIFETCRIVGETTAPPMAEHGATATTRPPEFLRGDRTSPVLESTERGTCHAVWRVTGALPISNAAVRARSRHATSVHLGLAADSVAQADYDMAAAANVVTPIERVPNTVTRVRPAFRRNVGIGFGLFAEQRLPPGTLVAIYGDPGEMLACHWRPYCQRWHLPEEWAGLRASRGQPPPSKATRTVYLYDKSWKNFRPKWSYLNHRSLAHANCKSYTPPRSCEVTWVTTRAVEAGEELTFTYHGDTTGYESDGVDVPVEEQTSTGRHSRPPSRYEPEPRPGNGKARKGKGGKRNGRRGNISGKRPRASLSSGHQRVAAALRLGVGACLTHTVEAAGHSRCNLLSEGAMTALAFLMSALLFAALAVLGWHAAHSLHTRLKATKPRRPPTLRRTLGATKRWIRCAAAAGLAPSAFSLPIPQHVTHHLQQSYDAQHMGFMYIVIGSAAILLVWSMLKNNHDGAFVNLIRRIYSSTGFDEECGRNGGRSNSLHTHTEESLLDDGPWGRPFPHWLRNVAESDPIGGAMMQDEGLYDDLLFLEEMARQRRAEGGKNFICGEPKARLQQAVARIEANFSSEHSAPRVFAKLHHMRSTKAAEQLGNHDDLSQRVASPAAVAPRTHTFVAPPSSSQSQPSRTSTSWLQDARAGYLLPPLAGSSGHSLPPAAAPRGHRKRKAQPSAPQPTPQGAAAALPSGCVVTSRAALPRPAPVSGCIPNVDELAAGAAEQSSVPDLGSAPSAMPHQPAVPVCAMAAAGIMALSAPPGPSPPSSPPSLLPPTPPVTWDEYFARIAVLHQIQRREAATAIQAAARRRQAKRRTQATRRMQTKQRIRAKRQWRDAAATRIQAAVRRMIAYDDAEQLRYLRAFRFADESSDDSPPPSPPDGSPSATADQQQLEQLATLVHCLQRDAAATRIQAAVRRMLAERRYLLAFLFPDESSDDSPLPSPPDESPFATTNREQPVRQCTRLRHSWKRAILTLLGLNFGRAAPFSLRSTPAPAGLARPMQLQEQALGTAHSSCIAGDGQAFMLHAPSATKAGDIRSTPACATEAEHVMLQPAPPPSVISSLPIDRPDCNDKPNMELPHCSRVDDLPSLSRAEHQAVGLLRPPRLSPVPPQANERTPRNPPAMPASADAARLLVFEALEELLAEDNSPFALDPGDRDALHQSILDSHETILAGIPRGTLRADSSSVKHVARFCIKHNTPFVRPTTLDSSRDRARESFMYARFTVETARDMAPRSKSRRSESGEVITDAKPNSALGPLYGWRRILRDGGCELPSMQSVKSHLKGEIERFKRLWGAKALIPQRRLPFSQEQLRAIAAAVRSDAMMQTLKWTIARSRGIGAAFKYGLSTGARADELTHPTDHLRRSNLVLMKGKQESSMTPAELKQSTRGSMLRGRANPSKTDRDDMEWGDRDMWFRVNELDPLNFAHEWIQWELDFPCTGDRASWAAFSPDGGPSPFKTEELQRDFNRLLELAIGAVEAALRSWHALRVTAATALGAAKRPDGVVQCVIRWKTLEAMRLYSKMDRTFYADVVDEITTTPVQVTQFDERDLPVTGPADTVQTLEDSFKALDLDEVDAAAWVLDGVEPVKRNRGASSAQVPRDAAPPQPQAQNDAPIYVEIGGQSVQVRYDDSRGLVGAQFMVHNTLWPHDEHCTWDRNGRSPAVVHAQCTAPFDFGNGRPVRAYLIEHEENYYPIKESALKGYFPGKRKSNRNNRQAIVH